MLLLVTIFFGHVEQLCPERFRGQISIYVKAGQVTVGRVALSQERTQRAVGREERPIGIVAAEKRAGRRMVSVVT